MKSLAVLSAVFCFASIGANAAVQIENFDLGTLGVGSAINHTKSVAEGQFQHHLNFKFAGNPSAGNGSGGSGGATAPAQKWGFSSTITFSNVRDGSVGLFKKGAANPVLTFTSSNSTDWSGFDKLGAGEYFYQVIGNAGVGGATYTINGNVAPVPEPETYALMGMGLLGLLAARRRRVQK